MKVKEGLKYYFCHMSIEYDILIIGSGLGGLTCGSILSKEGYKVCILEQNPLVGGCLQNFKRNGNSFDTGMHYIGGFEKGQSLRKIYTYLGIFDKLKIQPLNPEYFDLIRIASDNSKYPLGLGYDRFIKNLSEIFPGEKANIEKYASEIQTICKSFHLYSLQPDDGSNHLLGGYSSISVGEFIDSVTDNEKLRTALVGNNMLYAGERYETPVFVHALITNMFITGASYFVDGSQQLANELANLIRCSGGEIITKSKVVHIEVADKNIKWVQTSDGKTYKANTYISAIHPAVTLDMIDDEQVQKSYKKRIKSIKNTTSSFTLFINFKKDRFKYLNHNLYYVKDYDSIWSAADYDFEKEWPVGFMMLTPPHSDSPEFAKTGIVNALMNFNDVREWEQTSVGKRGETYNQFKQKCIDRLLGMIEEAIPGFSENIESVFGATPLTIRDYTGSKDGTLYGTRKSINELVLSHIPPRTKLGNLLLTGQNLNMHGILGVPLTAVQTCGELIGLNNLINKINKVAEK